MSTSAALPELTGHQDDLLIGDVARLSGLSIDTLRYYDRAGLLGAVHRDGGGRRVFDRDTLGLLDVVLRLRRTGMPVEDVGPGTFVLIPPGAVHGFRTGPQGGKLICFWPSTVEAAFFNDRTDGGSR